MDEIHVHKTKKSICAHFAESPCTTTLAMSHLLCYISLKLALANIHTTYITLFFLF